MTIDTPTKDEKVNGPRVAAKIISSMPEQSRDRLLSAISGRDPLILRQITSNILQFEDLADITSNGLQVLIREVDHADLINALNDAPSLVKAALLKNMSERKIRAVVNDLQDMQTPSQDKIDLSKKKIMSKVEELRTAGIVRLIAE